MKLTDSQLIVLTTASQRDDLSIMPLPKTMKGAAAEKVIKSLLAKKLIAEKPVFDVAQEWRTADGIRIGLVITPAGLQAVGLEPVTSEPGADAPAASASLADHASKATKASTAARREKHRRGTRTAPAPKPGRNAKPDANVPRQGTKLAKLVAMLRRPEGATVDRIAKAMDWQRHTVRGAIAGALKRKLGLTVTSEKNDAGSRVYRIAG